MTSLQDLGFFQRLKKLPLAYRLYAALELENEDIICWNGDGDSFSVINIDKFLSLVLPKYFNHSKFHSFLRQLNLHGFRRVTKADSPYRFLKSYFHPYFHRDRHDLLSSIVKQTEPSPEECLLKVKNSDGDEFDDRSSHPQDPSERLDSQSDPRVPTEDERLIQSSSTSKEAIESHNTERLASHEDAVSSHQGHIFARSLIEEDHALSSQSKPSSTKRKRGTSAKSSRPSHPSSSAFEEGLFPSEEKSHPTLSGSPEDEQYLPNSQGRYMYVPASIPMYDGPSDSSLVSGMAQWPYCFSFPTPTAGRSGYTMSSPYPMGSAYPYPYSVMYSMPPSSLVHVPGPGGRGQMVPVYPSYVPMVISSSAMVPPSYNQTGYPMGSSYGVVSGDASGTSAPVDSDRKRNRSRSSADDMSRGSKEEES
jgi:hypothetical protein